MNTLKKFIYTLLDLLTFQKGFACRVNGFKVYFPARWFRYFESDYEKENIAFLKNNCKSGATVLDIGAHLGLMSAICAQLAGDKGHVYAFEPTPLTFGVLKKVTRMNDAQDIIHPVNKAVSNFTGELDFFVDENAGSNANSLVSRNDKNRNTRKTGVITIDDFVKEQRLTKIDLIKIDAEGSELDVLRGGMNSMLQFRPKMILALHPQLIKNNGQNAGDIYDLLGEMSYRIFFREAPISKQEFETKEDLFDVHLIHDSVS